MLWCEVCEGVCGCCGVRCVCVRCVCVDAVV